MEKNIEVVIGIAKCPNSSNLYGVRVEINKDTKAVTATWAFPIKPEVAKREGYSTNQFPFGIRYDSEYPGCPYCKKREDLVVITKPQVKPVRINVSTKKYDNIGSILDSLKIKYESYNSKKFDCDMLFINCGTDDAIDANQLRAFVSNGGCVYASDLTDSLICSAFPEYFRFSGHHGSACRISANVVDKELREIIGAKTEIEFDLGSWAVLENSKGETLLTGASGAYIEKPIMVKVKYGKGVIFYTCFHNYAQASQKEKALLQLFVLKQFGSSANRSLEETGSDMGVDIEKIKSMFKSDLR